MVSAEMLNSKLLSKQAAGIKHLYFTLCDGNHQWPARPVHLWVSFFSEGALSAGVEVQSVNGMPMPQKDTMDNFAYTCVLCTLSALAEL